MAETNITGPLWGFEHRSRRLGGLWPITFYAISYTLTPAANNINEDSALTLVTFLQVLVHSPSHQMLVHLQ